MAGSMCNRIKGVYFFKLPYKIVKAVLCMCVIMLILLFLFPPFRGDIVIAKSPSDPKSNICKRVIGLEGDKILTTSPSDIFKSRSYVSNISIMSFFDIIVD